MINYYICVECGHTKDFKGYTRIRQYADEIHLLSHTGDFLECLETDTVETDPMEGYDEIECAECGSNLVEQVEPNELTKLIYNHTRKDGSWSKEELPEEEKDFAIMEKAFIKNLTEEEKK